MFQKKPWHSRAKSPARKTKLDVVKMSNYQRKLRGKPQVNISRGRRDVYVCVCVCVADMFVFYRTYQLHTHTHTHTLCFLSPALCSPPGAKQRLFDVSLPCGRHIILSHILAPWILS